MATIDSKKIVDEIIAANGDLYPGEGEDLITHIIAYNNAFDGREAWGLVYEGDDPDRYAPSPFIINPRLIFERKVS